MHKMQVWTLWRSYFRSCRLRGTILRFPCDMQIRAMTSIAVWFQRWERGRENIRCPKSAIARRKFMTSSRVWGNVLDYACFGMMLGVSKAFFKHHLFLGLVGMLDIGLVNASHAHKQHRSCCAIVGRLSSAVVGSECRLGHITANFSPLTCSWSVHSTGVASLPPKLL